MAYNERLAQRVRALLADQPSLAERNMFGGISFLRRTCLAGDEESLFELLQQGPGALAAASAYVAEPD